MTPNPARNAILIADDQEAICFSLARLFESQGYVVFTAADGKSAVELLALHADQIVAVFLDVRMPCLDGLSALRAMRERVPDLRACLMTAYRQEPDVVRALETSQVPVLDKPFDLDDAFAVLTEVIGPPANAVSPPLPWSLTMTTRVLPLVTSLLLPLMVMLHPARAAEPDAIGKAVSFLKGSQADDGSWSKANSPAVTGIVLTGLLRSGGLSPDDAMLAKARTYVESFIDPKEGHLAGSGAKVNLHNYATCVNLMALHATGDAKYKAVIDRAAAYLKKLQWDEGEEKSPADSVYGGAGYGRGSRPDLSNTQFFLDALKASGIPEDDPALKRALVYVSRCQNLKGEHNDQPWAGKINDGSFIYGAGPAGETRGAEGTDGARPGYGSMTYAGLKGLVQCGVGKDDPRYAKAKEWIAAHYTVDSNPGMPPGEELRGLYYYLMTMAKCLDTLGVKTITDAKGVEHNWREEIRASLLKRQKPDGSWANENPRWMEATPDLCTAYALITLSYCR